MLAVDEVIHEFSALKIRGYLFGGATGLMRLWATATFDTPIYARLNFANGCPRRHALVKHGNNQRYDASQRARVCNISSLSAAPRGIDSRRE